MHSIQKRVKCATSPAKSHKSQNRRLATELTTLEDTRITCPKIQVILSSPKQVFESDTGNTSDMWSAVAITWMSGGYCQTVGPN
eukprot:6181716-Pleurochrysis_carterae.AAC.1